MGKSRSALLNDLLSAGFACQICGDRFSDTSAIKVDHDHVTDKARGLLCNRCNVGLGMFRDDPRILKRAHSYIRANRGNRAEAAHVREIPMATTGTDGRPREGAEALSSSGEKMIGVELVARLLRVTPGDIFKLSRLLRFPRHCSYWSEREVQLWLSNNAASLDPMRSAWEAKREASRLDREAKLIAGN